MGHRMDEDGEGEHVGGSAGGDVARDERLVEFLQSGEREVVKQTKGLVFDMMSSVDVGAIDDIGVVDLRHDEQERLMTYERVGDMLREERQPLVEEAGIALLRTGEGALHVMPCDHETAMSARRCREVGGKADDVLLQHGKRDERGPIVLA